MSDAVRDIRKSTSVGGMLLILAAAALLSAALRSGDDVATVWSVIAGCTGLVALLRYRDVAEAVEVSLATIERVRQRFVGQGLEAALVRKVQPRPSRQRALDGRAEARLIALACTAPPDGRKVWTMRLLADKLVELEVVPSISDETLRRSLKKAN